jgi:hypothetical protein
MDTAELNSIWHHLFQFFFNREFMLLILMGANINLFFFRSLDFKSAIPEEKQNYVLLSFSGSVMILICDGIHYQKEKNKVMFLSRITTDSEPDH